MNLIADVYERELDTQVQVVSTLIPPIVMVVIAVSSSRRMSQSLVRVSPWKMSNSVSFTPRSPDLT